MITLFDLIMRVLLAVILSGLIGLEREHLRKPAGVRTNILVGLGSTLIMVLALYLPSVVPELNVDPGRIAGQVITGIGFLGAGAIIRDRGGVHGLTTAASIWVVAAIGLAVGMGYFSAALVTALITLVTLFFLGKMENHPDSEFNAKNKGSHEDPL